MLHFIACNHTRRALVHVVVPCLEYAWKPTVGIALHLDEDVLASCLTTMLNSGSEPEEGASTKTKQGRENLIVVDCLVSVQADQLRIQKVSQFTSLKPMYRDQVAGYKLRLWFVIHLSITRI